MSALRLINETTGTSISSLSVTDVFTSDFDIYKIEIEGDNYNANSLLTLRLINSSGSIITSNYDNATLNMRTDAAYNELRNVGDTIFFERAIGFFDYNNGSRQGGGAIIYIFNPYSSSYTFGLCQSSGDFKTSNMTSQKGIGVYKSTDTITGYQVTQDTYTATYGEIKTKTYGLSVV